MIYCDRDPRILKIQLVLHAYLGGRKRERVEKSFSRCISPNMTIPEIIVPRRIGRCWQFWMVAFDYLISLSGRNGM